jgi:hypothetical protein
MRKMLIVVSLVLLTTTQSLAANDLPGGIRLLPGYTASGGWHVDSGAWTIKKKGRLTIKFKVGVGAGFLAHPRFASEYSWYAEQTIRGHRVNLALTKPGLITIWSPARKEQGTILLVSFPLGPHQDRAANFSAKVSSPQDVAEMLLIVLTYNPS